MEGLVSAPHSALRGRRVLLTGHTGFKGSWLLMWLRRQGATVTGYALEAPARSLYRQLSLDELCESNIADIRDLDRLRGAMEAAKPELIFHLAAQPLVLASYENPIETIQTNVVGTANLLEAVRLSGRPCAVVIVTSDKCYENRGSVYGYRETDPLGGHDVYSMSKAAAELVAASYRRSFFEQGREVRVATVRAGNVIGGGDYARDRIVPDCIEALTHGEKIRVRNPLFIRPWQHVLEPLEGYLTVAGRLLEEGDPFCEAWNFGPRAEDARPVRDLVEAVIDAWGGGSWFHDGSDAVHEARSLRLSTDKALAALGWRPRWQFDQAVRMTVDWYRAAAVKDAEALRTISLGQIEAYERTVPA